MAADVIPFSSSRSSWGEKLAEFSATQNPLDYLDALEAALTLRACLDAFRESQPKFLAAYSNAEWFAVFARACRILARIDWTAVNQAASHLPAATTSPSGEFKAALANFNAIFTQQAERLGEFERKAAAKGLEKFPPGFRFVDAFDDLYGNDNPMDYINKAIGILSPKEAYSHPDECWFSDEESLKPSKQQIEFLVSGIIGPLVAGANQTQKEYRCEETSFLKRELLTTIEPLLTQFFLDDLDAFSEGLREQASSSDGAIREDSPFGSYDGFLACVLKPGNLPVPQGLLMAVVRKILDTGFDPGGRNEELAAHVGLHLMGWPIGAPAAHWTGCWSLRS